MSTNHIPDRKIDFFISNEVIQLIAVRQGHKILKPVDPLLDLFLLLKKLNPTTMSKGQDKKKEEKKKPAKTMMEKRAEKRAKREGKQ
jgi:hypothetical protein